MGQEEGFFFQSGKTCYRNLACTCPRGKGPVGMCFFGGGAHPQCLAKPLALKVCETYPQIASTPYAPLTQAWAAPCC